MRLLLVGVKLINFLFVGLKTNLAENFLEVQWMERKQDFGVVVHLKPCYSFSLLIEILHPSLYTIIFNKSSFLFLFITILPPLIFHTFD